VPHDQGIRPTCNQDAVIFKKHRQERKNLARIYGDLATKHAGEEISLGDRGKKIKVPEVTELDGKIYARVPIKDPTNDRNKEYLINPTGSLERKMAGINEEKQGDVIVALLIPINNFDDLLLAALMADIYQEVDVVHAFIRVRELCYSCPGDQGFFHERICAKEDQVGSVFSQVAINLWIDQAKALQDNKAVVATFFSQPQISRTLDEINGHVENCYLSQIARISAIKKGQDLVIGNRNWVEWKTGEYVSLAIRMTDDDEYELREMRIAVRVVGSKLVRAPVFVNFNPCDAPRQIWLYCEDLPAPLHAPTVHALEAKMAALEEGEACAAVTSAMGAVAMIGLCLLSGGDHILCDKNATPSFLQFFQGLNRFGIEMSTVDFSSAEAVAAAMQKNTKIFFFTTPAPPLLIGLDIRRISDVAHSKSDVIVVVENTYATPVITKPLCLGADLVLYNAAGLLTGSLDANVGLVIGSKALIIKLEADGIEKLTGAVLSSMEADLAIRGIETLEHRVCRATENAAKLVEFLIDHPAVGQVYYPRYYPKDTPGAEGPQMKLSGNMIGFGLKYQGQLDAFLSKLQVIQVKGVFGGVRSTVWPMPETPGVLRLSVGIEGVDDLIGDLRQALA
jgi:methionine-gamma-lyase